MAGISNKKNPFNRTVILVTVFLLLLVCYFNLNYLKEKIRSFSINEEQNWLIERNSEEENSPDYLQKEEVEIMSPVFHMDTIYHSMAGPSAIFYFKPDNTPKSEIIWLTDYSVKVKDKKGKVDLPEDFICHNNLDVAFSELIRQRKDIFNNRLIMLTQGQTQLHFPKGFALPLLSHDNISITTQALNHNISHVSADVRHKITIKFIRNHNIKKRIKPLFKRTVNVVVAVNRSAVPGSADCDSVNRTGYTGYWQIPPGPDTVKYDVTSMMKLHYTTTLQYASVYAHAYCTSLTLKDVTTGRVVFTSTVKNYPGKIGTENIGYFSSEEGTRIYTGHNYELICITNNSTPRVQNMMAGMILYFYDKELDEKIGGETRVQR